MFDVLEYIAYAKPTVSRADRVKASQDNIYNMLNEAQREFVDYVLCNYIESGVDALDDRELSKVLNAKYNNVVDAEQQLGDSEHIRDTFIGFQPYLYTAEVA